MQATETTRAETEGYYREYEARKGHARNDLLRNPEVLFQVLAADASLISALRFIQPDPKHSKVLDVGCGDGASLLSFLRLGFDPTNLYGVDIRTEQLRVAQMRLPAAHLECSDASQLGFSLNVFDIVGESMMFLQLTDDLLSQKIAREMLRVTKPGGHLLLLDWRYGKLGNSEFKALDRKRISELFCVGSQTIVCGVFRGALVPPVGRFLSKYFPSSHFLVRSLVPFLVGQVTTVLRKVA